MSRPPNQAEIDYSCPLEINTRRAHERSAMRLVALIWLVAIGLAAYSVWEVMR